MKKILMTLMASMLLLSSTTYATETVNHKTHMVQKQSMTKQDMQAMFATNKVKVNALDNGEMAKTEGEYGWWGAFAGAASGAYGYLGYAMGSHRFSWTGLGGAVTAGTIRGVLTPTPTAVAWTMGSHAGMAGGYSAGSLWNR